MYEIAYDRHARVLNITLEGFWSVATLARFSAEMLVKVSAAKVRHGAFSILSDSRQFPVQSSDMANGFQRIMARGSKAHRGATAIVVGSQLAKMQAERAMASPRLKVFLEIDEARRWLASEERGSGPETST